MSDSRHLSTLSNDGALKRIYSNCSSVHNYKLGQIKNFNIIVIHFINPNCDYVKSHCYWFRRFELSYGYYIIILIIITFVVPRNNAISYFLGAGLMA